MKFPFYAVIAAGLCSLWLPTPSFAQYNGPAPASPRGGEASDPASQSLSGLANVIASPDIPSWTRLNVSVASCKTPPVIDGSLDDPCWSTATHHAGFYPVGSVTPVDSADQTEVWVCADKTRLYIAFHCIHRRQSDIQAREVTRDGDLGHDDYVGVDIDSQNAHHGFSTFQVSARGTQAQRFEGGTPDNIAWMGDWTAAARQVPGGWTAELSIPFPLLRYPKGSTEFGIDFFRNISHSSTLQCWPYLPPEGTSDTTEGQYLSKFTGISPPFYTRRPTFLSYALGSAGQGSSVKDGLDVRYPLTTTLTAVGTVRPDFQTIEQSVSSVNFSYTEKFVLDRRPFFAEGRDFLPTTDVYYSQRIGQIDGGVKVVGKQGNTTIGLLDTETSMDSRRSAAALNLQQDLNQFSSLLVDYVRDQRGDIPNNAAAKVEGNFGWQSNRTRYGVDVAYLPTWYGEQATDSKLAVALYNTPIYGRPGFSFTHTDIGPNFINRLGFVPETDMKGNSFNLSQYNQFDWGWIQNYSAGASISSYQHHSGGFFHNDVSCSALINTRSGLYLEMDYDTSRRNDFNSSSRVFDQFHDHVATAAFGWGKKTLYQQGGVRDAFGEQAAQSYNFFDIYQNILVTGSLYLNIDYSRLNLGNTVSDQTLSSITYRVSAVDSVGGRAVSQGSNTDVYLSFGHHVRSGNDLFIIFGDPNSPRTRGVVSAKLVRAI